MPGDTRTPEIKVSASFDEVLSVQPFGSGEGERAVGGGQGERGERVTVDSATVVLSTAMTQMQTDAPACDICGTITVRNGTCYKCLNCGNSMGCS